MDRQAREHGSDTSRRRRVGAALVLVLAITLLGVGALSVGSHRSAAAGSRLGPARPLGAAARQTPFRAGVVLVGFRAGVSAQEREAAERAAGAWGARRLGPAIEPIGHGRAAGAEYTSPFAVHVPAKAELATASALRGERAVAYAEPDYVLSATALPNDPSFALQWADRNTGQAITTQEINEVEGPPAAGTAGADDGAFKAWQVSTGSRSIVIGEADTGVEYTHPDLAANIWSNPGGIGGCAIGTHGYNVRANNCNPMDEDTTYNGHGTHVAGILGAVGNNATGVAGMNWHTSILPVKWMSNASNGETSALIEALQWLVAAKQAGVNVRVVNDSDTFFGTAYSQALSNEIDVLGANNILFVTSAGNTGNNNDEVAVQRYPCSYDRPTEICVAPIDNNDQLPSWANYGPHTVDLAAPGVSIYSTLRGGTYGYMSGSSMAAPQVAGAAALVLSVEPSLSASALKADILENVDHLPSLAGRLISGGSLDVCKAMPGCAKLAPQAPTNTAAPTVAGAAITGQTLTEAHGTWTGEPSSYAYQWQRCEASGAGCQPILSAKAQTYVPVSGDLGHALRVAETATGAGGPSNAASSAATARVVAGPPVSGGRPAISGVAAVGQTLSASTGKWSEYPTAYSYQWQRCDSRGNHCAAIALASHATYTLAGGDLGATLRVAVTASNAAGTSAPATSAQTQLVRAPGSSPPVNTGAPSISGQASVGQTLTASTGRWSEYPTAYSYQWLRCDAAGNNCAAIALATYPTYALAAADAGSTLRVAVTASNAAGSSPAATSARTVTVTWQQPSNTAPPTISGTAQAGQTLTATNGTWTGEPTSFADQWQRCNASGSSCTAIAGATASTYALSEADAESTLRVVVTASNPSGRPQAATSAASAVVLFEPVPQAPTNTSPPTISGTAAQAQTLTEVHGTWSGEPTAYAYQWLRCDASGGSCQPIEKATAQTYLLAAADVAHTLRVTETAANAAGTSNTESSAATGVVAALQGAATFGKTSVGASFDEGLFANYKIVNRATLGVAGSVSELSVYAIPGLAAPGAQALKAVIYADAGGTPGALLATGSEEVYRSSVNGTGWLSLPLTAPVHLQPGTYWIGFITGPTSEGMGYVYDSVESSRAYDANEFSAGPTEAFGTATLDSEQASIYATYVPG